jgi:hypothetical protein
MALASRGYLRALCTKRAWKCGKKPVHFLLCMAKLKYLGQ